MPEYGRETCLKYWKKINYQPIIPYLLKTFFKNKKEIKEISDIQNWKKIHKQDLHYKKYTMEKIILGENMNQHERMKGTRNGIYLEIYIFLII